MSIRRGWAIFIVLAVTIVLVVFLDVLPTYRNLKNLSVLKNELSALKEVTDVYKKALNRLRSYDKMVKSSAIDRDKLENTFSRFGLAYKKQGDSYSFKGFVGEREFKEILDMISNNTNLTLTEMKVYNMQEIPITFGKPRIIIAVDGKIKLLSTSLGKTKEGG
ncbi:MAG: hypothetical protein DRP30_04085 [Thermotoga sp.]|nr:MAG: hypothetical protein DRP30_04085 [Thermotoga sp.]